MSKANAPASELSEEPFPMMQDEAKAEAPVDAVKTDLSPQDDTALPPKAKKKHKARIEHKIPGRIRMKVPHAKSNPEILKAYSIAFSAIPGITNVAVKPETGSIVIQYDPRCEADFHHHLHHACEQHDTHVHGSSRPGDEIDDIASKIENEAEFLAQHSALARVTVDFCKNLDREMKTLTDNTVDLKILLAGGLAAFTFFEIGAEAATPMWVTLVLFSLNHLTELHVPHDSVATPIAEPASNR
jgi:Heavy metal associated domain 2